MNWAARIIVLFFVFQYKDRKSDYSAYVLNVHVSLYCGPVKVMCTTSMCSYISGPQGSWSAHVCCLHLKVEYPSCARGRQWCGIIHYY